MVKEVDSYLEEGFEVGIMCYTGMGLERDLYKAYYFLKKVSENGHEKAQFYLGTMYYQGLFVEQDFEQALYWFKKSADKRYLPALMILQFFNYSFNESKFVELFHELERKKETAGMVFLSYMYRSAIYVEYDREKAEDLLLECVFHLREGNEWKRCNLAERIVSHQGF